MGGSKEGISGSENRCAEPTVSQEEADCAWERPSCLPRPWPSPPGRCVVRRPLCSNGVKSAESKKHKDNKMRSPRSGVGIKQTLVLTSCELL